MATKNIQMRQSNGTGWDDLFPKTKSALVSMNNGKTVETAISEVITSISGKTSLADVKAEVDKIIGSAPSALDTLQELATALGNDANFSTTITNLLANKVDKETGKGLSSNDFTTTLLNKLNSLNNYSHPTGDGNQHVPATGTSNNGKFLKAGSTAGSASWQNIGISDVSSLQTELNKRQDSIVISATAPTNGASLWFQEV